MNANTYPLTAHLSAGSIDRLVYWSISYALSHPGELDRARLAAGLAGDKYHRAAAGALIAAAVINATPGNK
jgi:hypothetical protein